MKKVFLAIILLLTSVVSYASVQQVCGNDVPLEVGIDDPTNNEDPLPKSPILIPSVSQDGYELSFQSSHPVYTLYIIENEVAAYSVIVSSSTTSVVLPSWLSGEYELQLHPDGCNYYFYGFINL